VREVESLDGEWDFVVAPERRDRGRLPRTYSRRVYVPSAWETIPGLETYRGRGWLRRRFHAPGGKAMRFAFGAVSHTAAVYVDGRRVACHYDGFIPWDVVVPGLKAGEHELVVEVENTFGKHSALHTAGAAHWSSGGITRPVELQAVPEVFIDKVFATPVRRRGGWDLDVRVRLRNVGRKTLRRRVAASVAGKRIEVGAATLGPRKTRELRARLGPLRVRPWSAESPTLYDLTIELRDDDAAVDDLIDRVGFREIKVRGKRLLLNGRPLRLRGYNRHEYHAQYGSALPVEAMAHDLRLLRDLGCNFVRTSHYPNDMRFFDLCDRMGFYVWEETNSTGVGFKHPKYREQITACAETMVAWHFNRPSIVIWATLNECDSRTPSGRREYARMLNLLRKLDGSRPVTFASNAWQNDVCLDLVDIVSWNWYEAWYWGSTASVREGIDRLLAWQDSARSKGGKGKPVILSEFGAGGFHGFRSPAHEKWSEEYQSDVLDESLRVYLNHPRICGAAIWQFCDVRVTETPRGTGPPRSHNNKGTFDELRRPKLSYGAVRRRMHEAAQRRGA